MSTKQEQLDLFVALIGDVPLRDDREMMSAPMVSLAKRPPDRLEWHGPSGQHVIITARPGKIATIWDFDVIIWAISQINTALERGRPTSPTITFRPYDMLKAIGREPGGRQYELLKASLDRLRDTRVRTTIRRRDKERYEDFSLLSELTLDERDGKPLGAQITLPRWIYHAVLERTEVLAISPEYFKLTSGLDRFLYRLARRHAGNGRDNPDGWCFTFRDLHTRTGARHHTASSRATCARPSSATRCPPTRCPRNWAPTGRCCGFSGVGCCRRGRDITHFLTGSCRTSHTFWASGVVHHTLFLVHHTLGRVRCAMYIKSLSENPRSLTTLTIKNL